MQEDGSINLYTKKEALSIQKETVKLDRNLGGIKMMKGLPSVLFVVDPKRENIAVDEANRLGIPVIAIADTNCDPDGINFIIPGNDDAIKSVKLICSKLAEAVLEGQSKLAETQQASADKEAEAQEAAAAEPSPEAPEADTGEGKGAEA